MGGVRTEDGLPPPPVFIWSEPLSSLFERIWLMTFWEWVQRTMYPRWLAPNMITFIGFLCVMVSFVSMLYYSPMLDGSCPPWWYLLTAVTCFVYQTCDGSDGKQVVSTILAAAYHSLGCRHVQPSLGLHL